MNRDELNERLISETCVLENPLIRSAFLKVDRADFVGLDYKVEAYEDYALPIGFGQTISQPTTVAFMLELLDAKEGDRVLDIGAGSAWTSVLLAKIVGEKGSVLGLEIVPELLSIGKENVAKYGLKQLKLEMAEKSVGKPGLTFDRILVSASSEELPENILPQLNNGGNLVLPIKDSIWKIWKDDDGNIESKEYPG